jgi:hypothetical protein
MVPIFHLQFSKTYYDHNIKRKSETQRNLVDGLGLADVATVYTNIWNPNIYRKFQIKKKKKKNIF